MATILMTSPSRRSARWRSRCIVAVAAPAARAAAADARSIRPRARSRKSSCCSELKRRSQGRCTLPDAEGLHLIEQPAGRDWRQFHEVTLRWIGAIAILGMLALLVVFYLCAAWCGSKPGAPDARIVRFNAFERFVHWMTATCFIVLALTGLNITFGKPLLLPLIGPEAFTTWSQWGEVRPQLPELPVHARRRADVPDVDRRNIPNQVDVEWIKEGGGIVGDKHPPADRFNAGQKMIYWIVVLGGGAVAVTGYLLMFPFYGTDIAGMQLAQIVHGVVGVLFVAAMLAHIYIGTIGMEGAFEAMGTARST